MRARFVFEKFEEGTDPVRDLKIGGDPDTFYGYLKLHGYEDIEIHKGSHIHSHLIRVLFSKGDYFEFMFDVDAHYTKSFMRGFKGFKPWLHWRRKGDAYWRCLIYPRSRILKSTDEKYLVKALKLKLEQFRQHVA